MAVDFFVISCFLGGWRNYHALNDNKYSLVSVKVVNHFGNTWFCSLDLKRDFKIVDLGVLIKNISSKTPNSIKNNFTRLRKNMPDEN